MSENQVESTEINKAQILLLISSMERHEKLRGRQYENKEVKKLWREVVVNLNAIGKERSLDEWKQIWRNRVKKTNTKSIDVVDVQIFNMFQPKLSQNAAALERRAEDVEQVAVKIRAEADVAEENKFDVQTRLLTHIVGCLNPNTRVLGNGFNRLRDNTRKIAKADRRNQRR